MGLADALHAWPFPLTHAHHDVQYLWHACWPMPISQEFTCILDMLLSTPVSASRILVPLLLRPHSLPNLGSCWLYRASQLGCANQRCPPIRGSLWCLTLHRVACSAVHYPLGALLADCRAFFTATGRRVTIEYTLLAGVNDSPQQVQKSSTLAEHASSPAGLQDATCGCIPVLACMHRIPSHRPSKMPRQYGIAPQHKRKHAFPEAILVLNAMRQSCRALWL